MFRLDAMHSDSSDYGDPPFQNVNVTLDTTYIIDLEEGVGTARSHARKLAKMHDDHKINLRVVAISASEKKPDRTYASNFSEFRNRLTAVGLGKAQILKPLCYFDITYNDWCVTANVPMLELEQKIHEVLFPKIQFSYEEFCKEKGLDPKSGEIDRHWRNQKCDVLAMWSHIRYGGGIFVTKDKNYCRKKKKPRLIALGAGEILKLDQAVAKLAFEPISSTKIDAKSSAASSFLQG